MRCEIEVKGQQGAHSISKAAPDTAILETILLNSISMNLCDPCQMYLFGIC